jgi:hypothetical protein
VLISGRPDVPVIVTGRTSPSVQSLTAIHMSPVFNVVRLILMVSSSVPMVKLRLDVGYHDRTR